MATTMRRQLALLTTLISLAVVAAAQGGQPTREAVEKRREFLRSLSSKPPGVWIEDARRVCLQGKMADTMLETSLDSLARSGGASSLDRGRRATRLGEKQLGAVGGGHHDSRAAGDADF